MDDLAFKNHGAAFENLRAEMRRQGKTFDEVEAAFADLIRPYYLRVHNAVEGRSYRHFEVGIVEAGRQVPFLLFGGDTRHYDAREVAWRLAEARKAGADEVKVAVRHRLGVE